MGCGRFSAKYEKRRQHKRLAFSFMIIKVVNVKGKLKQIDSFFDLAYLAFSKL